MLRHTEVPLDKHQVLSDGASPPISRLCDRLHLPKHELKFDLGGQVQDVWTSKPAVHMDTEFNIQYKLQTGIYLKQQKRAICFNLTLERYCKLSDKKQ